MFAAAVPPHTSTHSPCHSPIFLSLFSSAKQLFGAAREHGQLTTALLKAAALLLLRRRRRRRLHLFASAGHLWLLLAAAHAWDSLELALELFTSAIHRKNANLSCLVNLNNGYLRC